MPSRTFYSISTIELESLVVKVIDEVKPPAVARIKESLGGKEGKGGCLGPVQTGKHFGHRQELPLIAWTVAG
jgi:hypothetical protein